MLTYRPGHQPHQRLDQTLTLSTAGDFTRPERHRLFLITVCLTSFSYIPHEIIRSGPSITVVTLCLVLACTVKYSHELPASTTVEWSAASMALWIALRLAVIGPLEGDNPIPVDTLGRELAGLASAVLLFKLGRVDRLRPTAIRGLTFNLLLVLAVESYQLVVGLGALRSLGYTEVHGFHYYTENNTFRPFATFLSPTVFAAYLAMLGLALAVTFRVRAAALTLIATTVGLLLTETRNSWIAFAVGGFLGFTLLSQVARAKVTVIFGTAVLLPGTGLLLLYPGVLNLPLQRIATLADTGFTSNATRIQLWSAVIRAFAQKPLEGWGPDAFEPVLSKYIGRYAILGHAHSNYLQILFLYGLLGLLTFMALNICALQQILRSDHTSRLYLAAISSTAIFALVGLFEVTWGSFTITTTFFLIVGIGSRSATDRPHQTFARAEPVGIANPR